MQGHMVSCNNFDGVLHVNKLAAEDKFEWHLTVLAAAGKEEKL
jgi:hypothetical protein